MATTDGDPSAGLREASHEESLGPEAGREAVDGVQNALIVKPEADEE
jgi:hypothetical protein